TILVVFLAAGKQFMGDVESGHHGDPFRADDLAAHLHFLHLLVEEGNGSVQLFTFFRAALDEVFLVEDADRDRPHFGAHVRVSIARRREIMDSMRARACSVFSMSAARSLMRLSCCARSAVFSSLSCSSVRISSSTRASSAARSRFSRFASDMLSEPLAAEQKGNFRGPAI